MGTRKGSLTFMREKGQYSIVEDFRWFPGAVWDGGKSVQVEVVLSEVTGMGGNKGGRRYVLYTGLAANVPRCLSL